MADNKSYKGLSKTTIFISFLIIGLMALFPFYEFLATDYLRALLLKVIVFAILFVIIIISLIGFLFKKSFWKSAVLFIALCLVIYGELNAYIGMQKNVPENYYKEMTTVLKNEKTPVSIKKYLYDVSSDGIVTYREWLVFATRYEVFLATHEKDLNIDQREQDRFLRARERVVM